MFVDSFKLRKDAWHAKLMKAIWGYNFYDFSNFCPYFWLTLFNILITPTFGIIIGLRWFFSKLIRFIRVGLEAIDAYCTTREEAWLLKHREQLMRELETGKGSLLDELYKHIFFFHDGEKFIARTEARVLYNKGLNFQEQELVAAWADQERLRRITLEREEKAPTKTSSNKQVIGKIVVVLKPIMKVVIVLIGVAICYFAALGLIWLYNNTSVNWYKILAGFITILLCVIGVALIIGLLMLLGYSLKSLWCKYGEYCIPCKQRRESLLKWMSYLVLPVVYVAKGFYYIGVSLVRATKFCWAVFRAMKEENCPAIEWEK